MKGLKRKRFAGAVFAAVMVFTAAAPVMQIGASAETVPVWSEDFESYEIGESVGSNGGEITNNPDTPEVPNKTAFFKNSGGWKKIFDNGLTDVVEFNVRARSSPAPVQSNFAIRISGDNGDAVLLRYGCLSSGTDKTGKITINSGTTYYRHWAALTPDSGEPGSFGDSQQMDPSTVYGIKTSWGGWDYVKVLVDLPSKTYDVYISGQPITQEMIDEHSSGLSYCEDIPLYEDVSEITGVSFEAQWINSSNVHNVYFDDISVNQITDDEPSTAVEATPIGEEFEDGSMGWTAEASFDGTPTSAVWTVTNSDNKKATINAARIPTVEGTAVRVGLVLTQEAIGENTISGVTFELK